MHGATCPHCGQPLTTQRAGARLTPLKARIFDAIKRAGHNGIDADDLFKMIFTDARHSRLTLKAHIWQINDVLEDSSDLIIKGTRGTGRRYILQKRK
jgi:hypothetical protein